MVPTNMTTQLADAQGLTRLQGFAPENGPRGPRDRGRRLRAAPAAPAAPAPANRRCTCSGKDAAAAAAAAPWRRRTRPAQHLSQQSRPKVRRPPADGSESTGYRSKHSKKPSESRISCHKRKRASVESRIRQDKAQCTGAWSWAEHCASRNGGALVRFA